jgi:hypothetical protein
MNIPDTTIAKVNGTDDQMFPMYANHGLGDSSSASSGPQHHVSRWQTGVDTSSAEVQKTMIAATQVRLV